MTKSKKILAVIFIIEAVILGIFRGVLLTNYIDDSNGLYKSATLGNAFLGAVAIVLAVTIISYLFFGKQQYGKSFADLKKGSRLISLICAVCLGAMTVNGLLIVKGAGILFAIELVFCVLSAISFVMIATGKISLGMGIVPLITSLWLGIRTIRIFIDTTTQINASDRTFTLLLLVSAMLFFLSEAEFFIPHTEDEKHPVVENKRCAKFIVTGFVVFQLAFAFAGARLIIGGDTGVVVNSIAELSIGAYAFARVFEAE